MTSLERALAHLWTRMTMRWRSRLSVLRPCAWLTLFALVTIACGPGSEGDEPERLASTRAALDANYPSVHIRGTLTAWDALASIPMTLTYDHVWAARITFPAGTPAELKFDVHNDWSLSFGENDGDFRGDRNGRNIVLDPGKTYDVTFDDRDQYYTAYEYVPSGSADIVIEVSGPGSAEKLLTRRLYATSGDFTVQLGLYLEETGRVLAPMNGARPGSWTATLDTFVDGIEYTGEVEFAVEADETTLVALPVTSRAIANTGTLVVHALGERLENGQLITYPIQDMLVYLGDWHAGERLGPTDAQGTFSTLLPEGPVSFSLFMMSSSHSVLQSGVQSATVVRGQTTSVDVRLSPYTVRIAASADLGMGDALYITGQTYHLGDWATARRLTWDAGRRAWLYVGHLPIGTEFKLVRAPWSDQEQISTTSVTWEQGANHVVPGPSGYYEVVIDYAPSF